MTVNLNIGNVYQDQGKYEEALVELKKGLDVLVSDHPDPDIERFLKLVCGRVL